MERDVVQIQADVGGDQGMRNTKNVWEAVDSNYCFRLQLPLMHHDILGWSYEQV